MSSKYDVIINDNDKKSIINDYVDNNLSIKDLCVKYNIKSKDYVIKLLGSKKRSVSEANIVAHKKYKERFLHSEETKEKIRQKRLLFMKEHPEKTAWRMGNFSYVEKVFQNFLIENNYDKNHLIIREYSVFPYYIDFAFLNEKIAIEIDGSQHLEKERLERDKLKDKLLIEQGWKVIRFSENIVKTNWDCLKETINFALENSLTCEEPTKVGIIKKPKSYVKKERNEKGYTEAQLKSFKKQRKVERPSKEELEVLIKTESFLEIGRKYDVSDNAIRKWCKDYNLPFTKKEINKCYENK